MLTGGEGQVGSCEQVQRHADTWRWHAHGRHWDALAPCKAGQAHGLRQGMSQHVTRLQSIANPCQDHMHMRMDQSAMKQDVGMNNTHKRRGVRHFKFTIHLLYRGTT